MLLPILASIALAGSSAQGTDRTAAPPNIEIHRVGQVLIGQDAQELYQAFPPERRQLVDLGREGFLSPALLLRLPGTTRKDAVVAELVCQRGLAVWRIEVRDPALKTTKGIGVGSSVGQLRAAYRLGDVLSGEGNVVIRVEELSASFILDQTGPGGDRLWRIRNASAIPDSVRIQSVLLTR